MAVDKNDKKDFEKARLLLEEAKSYPREIMLEVIWNNVKRSVDRLSNQREEPLNVLDVGSGAGDISLRLARENARVTLLEPSYCLLHTAEERARDQIPTASGSLSFLNKRIEDLGADCTAGFELIICHETIEYVDDPLKAINVISAALKPRGILSLVFLNRYGEVVYHALRDMDPIKAIESFDNETFPSQLHRGWGRLYAADELLNLLEPHGFSIEGRYAIGMLCDYIEPDKLKESSFYEGVLELEKQGCFLPAFQEIGRLTQLICRKD